jgi:hypothetical protein
LIDEARTPLHIGAQLEFVIHQLEESIVEQDAPGVVRCEEARNCAPMCRGVRASSINLSADLK